jgi:hypothetical protein
VRGGTHTAGGDDGRPVTLRMGGCMDKYATASWAEVWHVPQTPPARPAELVSPEAHSWLYPHEQLGTVTPGFHHPINGTPSGQAVAPWLT